MFAPRVYVSMIAALSVFAVVTLALTGSAWTTLWQTLVCAVLLQVGYFIAVFALIVRTERSRRKSSQRGMPASSIDDKDPKAIHVPSNRRHFNS